MSRGNNILDHIRESRSVGQCFLLQVLTAVQGFKGHQGGAGAGLGALGFNGALGINGYPLAAQFQSLLLYLDEQRFGDYSSRKLNARILIL